MNSVVIRPEIPYCSSVPSNFYSGKEIVIDGIIPSGGRRFSVELQCNSGNIALATAIDLSANTLSICSKENNILDQMETISIFHNGHIQCNNKFKFTIRYDSLLYKIFIDNHMVVEYPQKISFERVTNLVICGEIQVLQITYNSPEMLPREPPPSYDECINFNMYSANTSRADNVPATDFNPNQQQSPYAASCNFHAVHPTNKEKYEKYVKSTAFVILILFAFVLLYPVREKSQNRFEDT